jgi:inosose dehydratase
MHVTIANAPVSWGVDYADDPENPPWPDVLDEISAAGYTHLELGPVGYLPEDPERLGTELAARRLKPVGTFIFDFLRDPDQRERVVGIATRACRLVAACGGTHLVVIDHLAAERTRVAGRPEEARRLDAREFDDLVAGIRAVAHVAAEHGLRPVLHPHAGTYVEYRDEIDRVLGALDAHEIGLCIDTGHLAYAGVDAVALFRDHVARTEYFHLKDVDAQVRMRAVVEQLDFESAVTQGIFCPLGQGLVDFPALHAALREHEFEGVATIEQDLDPTGTADPIGDARRSLAYLKEVGLADPRLSATVERTGA